MGYFRPELAISNKGSLGAMRDRIGLWSTIWVSTITHIVSIVRIIFVNIDIGNLIGHWHGHFKGGIALVCIITPDHFLSLALVETILHDQHSIDYKYHDHHSYAHG